MAREPEVKLFAPNIDELEARLRELGATKVKDMVIGALFYDTPDYVLREHNKVLRLRFNDDGLAKVTYKVRVDRDDSKDMSDYDEHEYSPSDLLAQHRTFLGMGYVARGPVIKHRVSYQLDSMLFEFDNYRNEIPRFIEVEGKQPGDVRKGIELLGYTMADTRALNMFELFEEYGIEIPHYNSMDLPLLK